MIKNIVLDDQLNYTILRAQFEWNRALSNYVFMFDKHSQNEAWLHSELNNQLLDKVLEKYVILNETIVGIVAHVCDGKIPQWYQFDKDYINLTYEDKGE